MARAQSRWLAVSWAPYSRMSDTFARELQGKLYCIHYLRFQSPIHAPFKYPLQALRTVQVLLSERPRAVHVQNPPFVCGLVVCLYCWLCGGQYVLHYHSAAFGRAWDWALPIQKFLARRAATNIVTSRHWAEIVRGWGAHTLVMLDPFLELPQGAPFPVGPGFNLAVVSTFAPDEPTAAIVQAAALLPEVHFYITGNTQKLAADLRAQAPPNVTFTGFLDPYREYPGLLRAADAVMVLTTRDHTLQLGGCEAVALGKPLITSDWAYLRDAFAEGAVFVAASAESIRDGVLELQRRHPELAQAALGLREASRREWDVRLQELAMRVGADEHEEGACAR
jgi:glycosyltransferase involved in cell wall biosynthesis